MGTTIQMMHSVEVRKISYYISKRKCVGKYKQQNSAKLQPLKIGNVYLRPDRGL